MKRFLIALALAGCSPDFTEEQVMTFTLDEVRNRCKMVRLEHPREIYKCGTIDVVLNDNPPVSE
jgi:hypothetical protein